MLKRPDKGDSFTITVREAGAQVAGARRPVVVVVVVVVTLITWEVPGATAG